MTENDPAPETCPQCLNQGGTAASCGLIVDCNYDTPKNALGGAMLALLPQANYMQGEEIVVNVSLMANHRGHFIFLACPILNCSSTTTTPLQKPNHPHKNFFSQHWLTFIKNLIIIS